MPQPVSEDVFNARLQDALGDRYDRALAIFRNFGLRMSFDVTNVLLHAIDQKKEEQVLTILEDHWDKDLKFQHSAIRGSVVSFGDVNKTEQTFSHLYENVLKLEPVTKL